LNPLSLRPPSLPLPLRERGLFEYPVYVLSPLAPPSGEGSILATESTAGSLGFVASLGEFGQDMVAVVSLNFYDAVFGSAAASAAAL
jgi:hypothetical protein